VSAAPVVAEESIDRITALLPYFDDRRLGACPYCQCVAAWINGREFGQHVWGCIQIMQGIETKAEQQ